MKMNLPNRLTMLRVALVPLFVLLVSMEKHAVMQICAFAVFVFASITDLLDGKIARERNMVTDFGKFMDPIADKLLVMSALVVMVDQSRMPGWVCIVMIAREFLVSGFRLVAAGKGRVIAAGIWGKLKTVLQMVYIPMALLLIPIQKLNHPIPAIWNLLTDITMYISLILTVWSGICYIWKNREYIKDM